MSYDVMGRRVLDYEICNYDGSRLQFRGPKRNLTDPYVAFLGTTETFGKFVAQPYPDLLAEHLPVGAVNLGMVNGGVDAYLNDPAILEVARGAELRVVQVMGALNLSNHFFKVHPRRNDRLIGPCEPLRRLYPDLDFAEFHFTKAMLRALQRHSSERYEMICRELQDIWLARMTMLLKLLGERTIITWLADAEPPQNAVIAPRDPMLIDAELIQRIKAKANAYVEIVPPRPSLENRTKGMLFGAMEGPVAEQMMGPAAHQEVALALQETCAHFLKA